MRRAPKFAERAGTTPIGDASGLIPDDVKTRRQLFIAEAKNIGRAVTKYLAAAPSKRRAPFTLEWAYRLHREMFGEVWEWAGKRRAAALNLGVAAHRIDPDLKNLLGDLAAWREHGSFSPMEQSARLHHRAVLIHPFRNGNGRWARMLANVWLKQCGAEPVRWPENPIGNESPIRQEYLRALKAADGGDYAPLIALHQRYAAR
ncbi:MAG: mobile mystery protein B [Candidatus Binataceae bacterium]